MQYYLKVDSDKIKLKSSTLHTFDTKVKDGDTLIVEMVKSKPIIKYGNEKYDIMMVYSDVVYKSITINKALELRILLDITKGVEREKKLNDLGI